MVGQKKDWHPRQRGIGGISGRGDCRGAELGSGVGGFECVDGVGELDLETAPELLDAGEFGRSGTSDSGIGA